MITGRWGRPSQVLLDLVVDPDGEVRGTVNPDRERATIRRGSFDAATGALALGGESVDDDGSPVPFEIEGRLEGETLCLSYRFGDVEGAVEVVRVEAYRPPRARLVDRFRPAVAQLVRRYVARFRPDGREKRRRLEERGETLESITLRDAVASDAPALAELHVVTWNATYRTTKGPSVDLRRRQWTEAFETLGRRDFVLVLEDRTGRLIGFVRGRPYRGEFEGEVSKIYLRWEYHGLGLGRRMMAEAARRFLDRGIRSVVLFAEITNPTVGFFDHMGGERLLDDRGLFAGAFAWRDVRRLLDPTGPTARSTPRSGGPPPSSPGLRSAFPDR